MSSKNYKLIFVLLVVFMLVLTGCKVDTTYSVEGFDLVDENLGLYQKKYSNDTEQVSLNNIIACNYSKAIVKFYEDEECTIEIQNEVYLVEGNNYVFCTIAFPRTKLIELVKLDFYRLKLFTVKFESNCSIDVEEQLVEEGSLAVKPEVELTKKGYKFKEWDYNFKKPIIRNMTIEAKWVANGYSVTYDPNGGEIEIGNTIVIYGDSYNLDIPTREGYTFLGWEYNGRLINSDVWNIAEDITVVAKWEQDLITSEIEYIIVGAIGVNLQWTYTNKETVILRTPYKNGYRFIGWYTDGHFQSERVYEIPYGTTGHITLYSRWKKFTLAGSKIAFLGDSISTFYSDSSPVNSSPKTYTDSSGKVHNSAYYSDATTGVNTVDKTWWYQVVQNTKTNLVVNNSIGGSAIYNWGVETLQEAAMNYTRIDTLAGADIVVVFMGTNDIVNGLENAKFKKSYDTMIKRIKEKCPDAYIFCCLFGYSAYSSYGYTDAKRLEFNEIISEIATNNDITTIDFSEVQTQDNYESYLRDALHPNADGMVALANKAIETIRNYVGAF